MGVCSAPQGGARQNSVGIGKQGPPWSGLGWSPSSPLPIRVASLDSPGPMHPGTLASWCSARSWPPREVVRDPPSLLLCPPCLLERLSGHSPAHEIAKNVEAVQVGVLAAPVHIAARDRLAQLVGVGEYGQHIICRGGEPGEWKGSAPSPQSLWVVLSLGGQRAMRSLERPEMGTQVVTKRGRYSQLLGSEKSGEHPRRVGEGESGKR